MKYDFLMFIGGLNISHYDKLVKRCSNGNSVVDSGRIYVSFSL